jgi:hypothetical protein
VSFDEPFTTFSHISPQEITKFLITTGPILGLKGLPIIRRGRPRTITFNVVRGEVEERKVGGGEKG